MTNRLGDKDDILASEFAMGLLEGDAKTNAAQRFDSEREFRALVEAWQQRLNPLLDEVQDVSPPQHVWAAIEAELVPNAANENQASVWQNLNFWRGISLVSGAVAAAALGFIVLTGNVDTQSQSLVASLTATGDAPAFLAKYNARTGALVISAGFAQAQEAKVAELWLIPADGVPRSLGLLSDDGKAEFLVTAELKTNFANGGTLAVSLEPLGGSPTGSPTGPVIASGKLQFL